jgi:FMN reductase
VTAADAVVAVTPVFAASYSGLFKTFVDVLEPDALAGKPVLLAATAGTARHSLVIEHAMRPLFSYLRALTVPTGVFAAPEDWAGGDAAPLSTRIERAARELTDLLTARAPVPPADPSPTRPHSKTSWPRARRCSPPHPGCRGCRPRRRRPAATRRTPGS